MCTAEVYERHLQSKEDLRDTGRERELERRKSESRDSEEEKRCRMTNFPGFPDFSLQDPGSRDPHRLRKRKLARPPSRRSNVGETE